MPPSSNNIPRKEEISKRYSEHRHTAGEPKEGEAASPGGTALGCLLTPRWERPKGWCEGARGTDRGSTAGAPGPSALAGPLAGRGLTWAPIQHQVQRFEREAVVDLSPGQDSQLVAGQSLPQNKLSVSYGFSSSHVWM